LETNLALPCTTFSFEGLGFDNNNKDNNKNNKDMSVNNLKAVHGKKCQVFVSTRTIITNNK